MSKTAKDPSMIELYKIYQDRNRRIFRKETTSNADNHQLPLNVFASTSCKPNDQYSLSMKNVQDLPSINEQKTSQPQAIEQAKRHSKSTTQSENQIQKGNDQRVRKETKQTLAKGCVAEHWKREETAEHQIATHPKNHDQMRKTQHVRESVAAKPSGAAGT